MNRRHFLKNTCLACMAIGAGISLPSCGTVPLVRASGNKGSFEIEESALAADKNMFLVRAAALDFDILLSRSNNEYTALFLQCTHNQNALQVTGTKIFCSAHGAEFGFDGSVKKGPAAEPLRRLKAGREGTKIVIRFS